MSDLVEFKLENGDSAFIQIEDTETRDRSNRGRDDEEEHQQAQQTFSKAIACIAPVGNSLLAALKDMNTPDEVKLEFGLTFNAKAGVVFTSVESAANFKVCITWKNDKTK